MKKKNPLINLVTNLLVIVNLVALWKSVLTLVTFVFNYFLVCQYILAVFPHSTYIVAPSNFAINPNVFLHAFVYCGREKVNKIFTYLEST